MAEKEEKHRGMWEERGRVRLDAGIAVFYFDHSSEQIAVVYQREVFKGRDIVEFGNYKVAFKKGDSKPNWFKLIE